MPLNLNEPWGWTEADLLQLISDQITESLTLDYKSSLALKKADKEKKDISKDVASFANSAGGTLLYGMKESGHLPESVDDGLDPNNISREWLENVIQSTIQRKIEGIRINQIALDKTAPGRVAYAVFVPPSDRAPHMSSDGRYYKRYNFQSAPMEEYEVRDVANRRTVPVLSCHFDVDSPLTWDAETGRSHPIKVTVRVENTSPAPAEYWTSSLLIDDNLQPRAISDGFAPTGTATNTVSSKEVLLSIFTKNLGIPGAMPIWRGSNFRVATFTVTVTEEDDTYFLGWEANVSGAGLSEGHVLVTVRDRKLSLSVL